MNEEKSIFKDPALPYIAPFVSFILLLVLMPRLSLGRWEQPVWVLVLTLVLFFFSRRVIDFRPRHAFWSIGVGIGVFILWVAPDLLWPEYRTHWLFQNFLTGGLTSLRTGAWTAGNMALVMRVIRAVVLVPIIEELFWRGWLMRWMISDNFLKVPLGSYTAYSFWVTALLFASEHGPYWEVGLLAGIAYNLWIIRTKKLGDCILAHVVTNGVLSAFVILFGRWEYWL